MISISKTSLLLCIILLLNAPFFIEGSGIRSVARGARELEEKCRAPALKKAKKSKKMKKASKKCKRRRLLDDELDEDETSYEYIYVVADEDIYTLEYCDDFREDGTGPCGADCDVEQFCCIKDYEDGESEEDAEYFCAYEVEDGDDGASWQN